MKKHLTSIQSTRPAQQKSIFSYYHHQCNNHNNSVNYNHNNTSTMSLITNNNYNNSNIDNINKYNCNKNIAITNYKNQLNNMFKTFQQILKMRSYLLQRDMQEIYDNGRSFFQYFLSIYSVEEMVAFVYGNKNRSNNNNKDLTKNNTNQKLYQRDQLQFIVNIIFELNKKKHQSASNSNMKQFQLIKQLLQFIQQKSIKYEKFIRQVKEKKHMEMKLNQYNERKQQFGEYESKVRKQLGERHERMRSIEMEKLKSNPFDINNNNNNTMIRSEKTHQTRLQYITNPSKQLSQAKQLSLRVKLSPYASQKKRQYDYSTLNKKLAQTINQDMERKYNMLDKMKAIEKEKLNKLFKRRYSVVDDKLKQEMNLTQRKLQTQKERLNRSLNNSLQTISNHSMRKKNQILSQLKNSLNAFNMHSDTQQIKKIIKHHRNSLQFESDIKQVSNLRTVSEYQPKYSTLTYTMTRARKDQHSSQENMMMMSMREKQGQQNRILRRLAKHKDNNKVSIKQAQCQYDLVNNNRNKNNEQNKTTINKQKSLVALYDDQLQLENEKKK